MGQRNVVLGPRIVILLAGKLGAFGKKALGTVILSGFFSSRSHTTPTTTTLRKKPQVLSFSLFPTFLSLDFSQCGSEVWTDNKIRAFLLAEMPHASNLIPNKISP